MAATPLEACAICCDEKLPEFLLGSPDYRCCRDFEACNRRAYRRLIGRPERSKRSNSGWKQAQKAYRKASRPSAVPVNGDEPQLEFEFDGEQLTLDWDDAA